VTVPPLDIAHVRAVFPDWRIFARGRGWCATRRQAETVTDCPDRFDALGRPEVTTATLADLAVQLATLEYPLGITPTS
jgi:hypothetical protein